MDVRNVVIALSLALLIPLAAYWGMELVFQYTMQGQVSAIQNTGRELDEMIIQANKKVQKAHGAQKQEAKDELWLLEAKKKNTQNYLEKTIQHNERYLFYMYICIGLAAILFGAFTAMASLGAGFILGGVLTIITYYIVHWARLTNLLKFGSLVIAIIIIIITLLAYRLMRKK